MFIAIAKLSEMITISEQLRNLKLGNKLHFRFKKTILFSIHKYQNIRNFKTIDDDNYNANQHTYRMVRYTSQNYHEQL